jgi:hypothetical protein
MAGLTGASGLEFERAEANLVDTKDGAEFGESVASSGKKLSGPQIGGMTAGGVGLVGLILGGLFLAKYQSNERAPLQQIDETIGLHTPLTDGPMTRIMLLPENSILVVNGSRDYYIDLLALENNLFKCINKATNEPIYFELEQKIFLFPNRPVIQSLVYRKYVSLTVDKLCSVLGLTNATPEK